jgi:S-adenosylmethionine decarboxylase proenzyme
MSSPSRGDRRNGQPPLAEAAREDGVAIDIRLFVLVIALSMMFSFYAGVAYGPPVDFTVGKLPPSETSYSVSFEKGSADHPMPLPERLDPTEQEHMPSGQHLLVDMKGVDADFLNSEERLSKAMVEVVNVSGLTLLSYHCHALSPTGVSCVGVLLESHISFHTWPKEGVITLDLFTCGSKPLLPAVQVVETLFGIPAEEGGKVRSRWSHELRGFRSEEAKKKNYLDDSSDLSIWVLSPLELYSKEQIYSNVTK